jgi:hypothetical protein
VAPSSDHDSLVVIVDGDGQLLLADFLADDVLVQEIFNLAWLGKAFTNSTGFLSDVVRDDLVTNINALVANKNRGAGDQFLDIVLTLIAETAAQYVLTVLLQIASRGFMWVRAYVIPAWK